MHYYTKERHTQTLTHTHTHIYIYKRSLSGAFSALQAKADCTLTPNEFLHSSPEAPRTIQARETSASEGRDYYQRI